jgi:hypothetical protein
MAISRLDMERQLRKDGGILTLEDAKKMAPPGESLAYINPEEAALLKSLGGAGEDINGTGIKSYFFKKVFKKAKRAVKKIVKSPIGKAAILGGLTLGVPGTGFKGLLGAGKGGGLGSFIKRKLFGGALPPSMGFSSPGILGKLGLTKGGGSLGLTGLGKIAGITGLSGLAGLAAAQEAEDEEGIDISDIDRGEGLNILDIVARARKNDPEFRFLPGAEFTGTYAEGGRINLANGGNGKILDPFQALVNYYLEMGASQSEAESLATNDYEKGIDAPKKKAEGGLMNLGGMEMDLRGGGFVPLGAKEKADDVPARLSKNEFVMTADAVRAAGGGSIDKGADKMYNLMKDLEAQV